MPPATRFVASDEYATYRPSLLIEGPKLRPFPCSPVLVTLTLVVVPDCRSRTYTCPTPFVPPATRVVASDENATYRPSALMEASQLRLFPCSPVLDTLTLVVVPVCRSRTNTSSTPFLSPATRFVASDENATYRPSPLIEGEELWPFAFSPLLDTLTSSAFPAERT